MSVETNYAVRRYQIAGSDWIPVVAPIACSYLGLRNAGNVTIEVTTDPTNADSYDSIGPGIQDVLSVPAIGHPANRRFDPDVVLFWIRGAGADARIKFIL
jgi:hypothetical protein